MRGTHLHRLPALLRERVEQASKRIPTSQLNRWLADVQRRRAAPTTRAGHQPRLYYVTQTGTRPPAFTLYVNAPERVSQEYRRFLWSRLVDRFGFHGTPVRLRYRKSE